MKIQKLVLENFRGFKGKHEIEFKPDVNVFIGINGAGKTTILDAVTNFLKEFIKDLTTDKNTKYRKDGNIININSVKTQLSLTTDISDELLIHNITYKRENISVNIIKYDYNINNKIVKLLLQEQPLKKLPIFTYYNSNNRIYDYAIDTKPAKMFEAYSEAFETNFREFKNFFLWYNNEENFENEKRLNEDNDYRNPKLEVIRTTVIKFSEHIEGFKFEKLRIQRSKTDEPLFLLEKGDEKLFFDMLSNGEKAIFFYVADIARRLAIANPGNLNADKEGEGIVLIDEIDLHLHPSWQREIIPALTKTFPNIQFFITTHSPQVLSNVKHKNVIVIEDFKFVEFTPNTYGKDSNSILWDIFGVTERPVHSQKKLDKLYELLEEEDKQKDAKLLLDELSKELGKDDPEILRAKLHFEFQNNNAE